MEDGEQIDAFLEQVRAFLWMSMAYGNVKFSWVVVVINHRYHDPPLTYSGYKLHIIFLFYAHLSSVYWLGFLMQITFGRVLSHNVRRNESNVTYHVRTLRPRARSQTSSLFS